MSVVIFSGPTISPEDVSARIEAICLPPIAQGDILRAMDRKPRAIGIIDGYFQGVPAVWHKEILWALSQGTCVFGSASMGALRAAELHTMGMIGVGRIFEDYKTGVLEDDDEVAVVHGPAELGFTPLGVPMVNVRATVDRAVDGQVIELALAGEILKAGKAIIYQERTWDAVFDQIGATGAALGNFRGWLDAGYVDQKRTDAEAMLDEMQRQIDDRMPAPTSVEPLQWTLVWQQLFDSTAPESTRDQAVLDELRLQPELFVSLQAKARLRALVLDPVDPAQTGASGDQRALLTGLRQRLGLLKQADFEAWMTRNDLASGQLDALVAEEAVVTDVLAQLAGDLDRDLLAAAKLAGEFETLKQRAAEKAAALGELGPGDALALTGMLGMQLAGWYFQDRLGRGLPEQIKTYAQEHGFRDLPQFYECVAREYLYLAKRDKAEGLP